jgi:hypothetical protein
VGEPKKNVHARRKGEQDTRTKNMRESCQKLKTVGELQRLETAPQPPLANGRENHGIFAQPETLACRHSDEMTHKISCTNINVRDIKRHNKS